MGFSNGFQGGATSTQAVYMYMNRKEVDIISIFGGEPVQEPNFKGAKSKFFLGKEVP